MLAVVGLVLAHAANNLINDYFDMTGGVDTEGYVRALYAPHPVLSGWVRQGQLRNAAIRVLTVVDAPDHARAGARNPQPLLIIGFALAGLFCRSSTSPRRSVSSSTAWANSGVFLVWGR